MAAHVGFENTLPSADCKQNRAMSLFPEAGCRLLSRVYGIVELGKALKEKYNDLNSIDECTQIERKADELASVL